MKILSNPQNSKKLVSNIFNSFEQILKNKNNDVESEDEEENFRNNEKEKVKALENKEEMIKKEIKKYD